MSVQFGPDGTAPPAALYRKIMRAIAGRISDGTWSAGDRISSEQDLVDEFGVSRMTVNRALRELADQGVLVRVAGVGTFVAEAKAQTTLLQVVNIADEIRARGHDYACVVKVSEETRAGADVAVALDIAPGAAVFHTVCVHQENGVPMQFEDRYVSPRHAPDFMSQRFSSACLPGDYLLRNVPLDQIEHIVDAVLPTAEQASLLEIKTSEPCLMLTRRTWTHGSATPVTFVRCVHPGRRYRLGSRFRANPASQLA